MCLSCVCGLLCKLISFVISLLFIVGLVLLILWLAGVIFTNPENTAASKSYDTIRRMVTASGN